MIYMRGASNGNRVGMMKKGILILTVFLIVSLFVSSILAATYAPAVKQGDSANYAVTAASSSLMNGQTTGQIGLTIQSTGATIITVKMTMQGASGTQVTSYGSFDLGGSLSGMNWNIMNVIVLMNGDMSMGIDMSTMNQGMTALRMNNMSLFMAGGLRAGDPLFPSSPLTFNQTLFRTYLQTNRSVNLMQLSRTANGHSFTMSTYWDTTTGIMTESTVSETGSTQSISLVITSTNLWGGIDLTSIGIVLGVMVVVVIAGLYAIRVRRSKTTKLDSSHAIQHLTSS